MWLRHPRRKDWIIDPSSLEPRDVKNEHRREGGGSWLNRTLLELASGEDRGWAVELRG